MKPFPAQMLGFSLLIPLPSRAGVGFLRLHFERSEKQGSVETSTGSYCYSLEISRERRVEISTLGAVVINC